MIVLYEIVQLSYATYIFVVVSYEHLAHSAGRR
jgi:hypothetical protein